MLLLLIFCSAKFLYEIGLQRCPPLSKLIELCAGEDEQVGPNDVIYGSVMTDLMLLQVRETAFQYLVDNIGTRYTTYDPMDYKDVKFIPALTGSASCLANIREVSPRALSQLPGSTIH